MISIQTDKDGRIVAASEGDGHLTDGIMADLPEGLTIDEIANWQYIDGRWKEVL